MSGLPIPTDANPIVRLRKVVHCLRAPGGCPWDIEQTHTSLIANLLEEAYEAAEAIKSDATEHMVEELGDLLLQVVMHAEIASETDRFTLEDIAGVVADKLIRRHPHVFGDSNATDTEAVLKQWDAIKRQEKGDVPVAFLKGVGEGLPALMTATKLQKKAAKVGFDWPDVGPVLAKVHEELAEVEEAMQGGDSKAVEAEIGDLLFAVVNLARKQGMDAESLMAQGNDKFRARFHAMEACLLEDGSSLEETNLERMDKVWNQIKRENSSDVAT